MKIIRRKNGLPATPSYQRGFSLIESLVALLVLAIGLLGLAALQTMGLRYTHNSYQQTQATYLIYDIVDRIRANPGGKNSGAYNTVDTSSLGALTDDCLTSTCTTPGAVANYDLMQWKTHIENALGPGSKGTIATAGDIRTISISWREQDVNMGFALEVQL